MNSFAGANVPTVNKDLLTKEILSVNNKAIGVLGQEGGLIKLASFVKPKTYFTRFDGGNKDGTDAIKYKHKGLSKNSTIEEVDLSDYPEIMKEYGHLIEYTSLSNKTRLERREGEDDDEYEIRCRQYDKALYYILAIKEGVVVNASTKMMRSRLMNVFRGESSKIFIDDVCDKMYVSDDGIELFPYGYKGGCIGSSQ